MKAVVHYSPWIGFVVVGVYLAYRWVVNPPSKIERVSHGFRVTALILSCWVGTFVTASMVRSAGYLLNDGVAYDDGNSIPYEVMYDGVGDNVANLIFGWSTGLIFWWVATLLPSRD